MFRRGAYSSAWSKYSCINHKRDSFSAHQGSTHLVEVAHPSDHNAIRELEDVLPYALKHGRVLSLLRDMLLFKFGERLGVYCALLEVLDPLPRCRFGSSSHALRNKVLG